MASRLREIVDAHRELAARDSRNVDELLAEARRTAPRRDFAAALRAPGLSVIAEIKRRSPSAGALNEALDSAVLAKEYEAGGAACISVLTDAEFFGGSRADLMTARQSVDLPVLRKDFTVDVRDIADARIMGADAVLLIVAVLSDDELSKFLSVSRELQIAALVEIHDEVEARRALDAGATIVGVNQRDLNTFDVDSGAAARLRPTLGEAIAVAESAITSVADAHSLHALGYDGVLIGTAFVTSDAPRQMLREIVGQ